MAKKPKQPTAEETIIAMVGPEVRAKLESIGAWDNFLKEAAAKQERAQVIERIDALKAAAEEKLTDCAGRIPALKELLKDGGTVTSRFGLVAGKITHDFLLSTKWVERGPGRYSRDDPRAFRFEDYQYLAQLIKEGKPDREIEAIFEKRKGRAINVGNFVWQAQGSQGIGGKKWIVDHWLNWKPGDPDPRPLKSKS